MKTYYIHGKYNGRTLLLKVSLRRDPDPGYYFIDSVNGTTKSDALSYFAKETKSGSNRSIAPPAGYGLQKKLV